MIFANVKGIRIPEGVVKRITQGSAVLWQAAYDAIVSGVPPLSLPSAVQEAIVYLKQLGVCEQNGTPTPTVPVDIKCNNGKLMFVSDVVPPDYVRLEYLEADGTQYIDTGIVPTTKTKYVVHYIPTSGSWIAGFTSGSHGRWGLAYNRSETVMTLYCSSSNCTMNIPVAYTEAEFDFGRGITYNGNTVLFKDTPQKDATGTGFVFKAQGSSAVSGSKMYYFAIYQNGNLMQELIPCRRKSDGELGMYDTITNTLFTNAGTGTFIAGEAVGQVEVDGTPEVLTICGKNIYNKNYTASEINAFINSNNNTLTQGTTQYVYVLPCKPNTTYTASGMGERTSRWGSFTSKALGTVATACVSGNGTITTGANDKYIIGLISAQSQGGDIDFHDTLQIEVGSTATDYEAYSEQTASVADLFAVDNIKDEQDVISGNVTRKCGIKILNGTETWTTDTYGGYRRMILQEVLNASGDTLPVVCTHYVSRSVDERIQPNSVFIASTGKTVIYVDSSQTINDVTDFTTYLASQYAAGTPVIVVYPLAEETTEQATAQALNTVEGTNTISVTAEVDNIPLEVKYKRN